MPESDAKISAIIRLNLCVCIGVALGLAYDNLSVAVSTGLIFGLFTPAKYFDAYLLGSDGRFSVRRAAIAAGAFGFVTSISIFVATYVTGYAVGLFRGLVS